LEVAVGNWNLVLESVGEFQMGRMEMEIELLANCWLDRLYSGVCHTDYGFCTIGFHGLPAPTAAGKLVFFVCNLGGIGWENYEGSRGEIGNWDWELGV
jgi:hypothetical protein